MKTISIALAQIDCMTGQVEENLAMSVKYIEQAAKDGAQVIVFPELALTGYNLNLIGPYLSGISKKSASVLHQLQEVALLHSIAIVYGMSMEKDLPGVIYNSAVVIDASGEYLGSYDKVNAFGQERYYYRSGNHFPVFSLQNDFKFGVMICYDAGFPEVARILASKGVHALICPAAWCSDDQYYWDLNLRSRAVDNIIPVVGVNRVGEEGKITFSGGSCIVNAKGQVIHAMGSSAGYQVFQLDTEEFLQTRQEFKHLTDLRTELYAREYAKLAKRG